MLCLRMRQLGLQGLRSKMRWLVTIALLFVVVKSCSSSSTHVVSLHWTASTTVGVVYDVYRSPHAKKTYVLLNPSGFMGLTFNDTSVLAGIEYDYYVTAQDANGVSPSSNIFTITVP